MLEPVHYEFALLMNFIIDRLVGLVYNSSNGLVGLYCVFVARSESFFPGMGGVT